ncbi:chromosomal replication initiator protein DnaA [Paralimibaculum aggregatum]|uniref:Chromosomal replication initiator protein DnaA n=1 Tax=Paralimibaculum aggregatum TaxID=3036245 RepID=A0ABQ6LP60_9RHOB|nr:chromosomal replication initiator protein DnaA [Limibaculum sp. NKW23]GMG82206.1 chromosomal replication initiator protein DnaA [Limibaculum sp. NKW23]
MRDGLQVTKDQTPKDLGRVWEAVLASSSQNLGRDCVEQWIRPVKLKAVESDLAIVAAPTHFMADWIERNYGLHLLRSLQALMPGIRRIDVIVATGDMPTATVTAMPAATPAQPEPQARQPGPVAVPLPAAPGEALESAPLDPRFTFDRFVVGKPNELAHAAARRVAETCDASFNPVFLYGGVGLGKTHLMHAIGHHLAETRPSARVLYLSAEQFMYRFVQALRFRDTMTFKQQFRSVDVLMVDDVQFICGKDSTQEEFFHTFNALIDQKKQIVISGDRSPDLMDGMEDRIKSRLQWGLVVDIHPTNYELRLGILQTKADAMLAGAPDVVLDPKVLEFLAHRISSNVRVLEGALTRLFAFAQLVGRRIDLDMTQECLSDLLRSAERKVSIDDIKRKVCDHYRLRMSDIVSARRARAVARPRQVAMFLAKQLTTKSLPEIGRGFGGRDHTTVIHAVKKIEELKATDPQLAEDIELLRRMLEA